MIPQIKIYIFMDPQCTAVVLPHLFSVSKKESKVPQNSQIPFFYIFSNNKYEELKFFHFWAIYS